MDALTYGFYDELNKLASEPSARDYFRDAVSPVGGAAVGGSTGGYLGAVHGGSVSAAKGGAAIGGAAGGAIGARRASARRFRKGFEAGSGAPLLTRSEETQRAVNEAAKDSAKGTTRRRALGTLAGGAVGAALGGGGAYLVSGDSDTALRAAKAGASAGSAFGYARSSAKETKRQHERGKRFAQRERD